jgi:hypothetical protein
MMAELMAERVQKRSKRRDILTHRRSHPQTNQHGLGMVIPEQFHYPVFSGSKRSGCEQLDAAGRGLVKLRCFCQKLRTTTANIRRLSRFHVRFDGMCDSEQRAVLRQIERPDPVTFQITCAVSVVWWSVR